jgi:hypothetical protein
MACAEMSRAPAHTASFLGLDSVFMFYELHSMSLYEIVVFIYSPFSLRSILQDEGAAKLVEMFDS